MAQTGLRTPQNILGQNGAVVMTTATKRDGPFLGFLVVQDAVLDGTGTVISEWEGDSLDSLLLVRNQFVPGLFQSIQLTSGQVIAYRV